MDDSWLSVADASSELGVSVQRVRELLKSGGLPGRKLGGSWFIDPVAVQRRGAQSSKSGRPLSSANAWRLLLALQDAASDDDAHREGPLQRANPVDRSRLRALLADLPDAEGLARRLSRRARVRRMRAHAGVMERLLADDLVSVGAGNAVAARGGGVATGGLDRIYVPAARLDTVVGRYRLRDDVEGNVELAVIPEDVDDALLPEPGQPVPLVVAWADLLDDPDSRVRNAAREWAAGLPRARHHADGVRR
jgi:hypothetical protein